MSHRAKAEPAQLSVASSNGCQSPALGQQAAGDSGRQANRAAGQRTRPGRGAHPLNDMARQAQTAIIVVTHDEKIIPTFKRIYHIPRWSNGREQGEGRGTLIGYTSSTAELNGHWRWALIRRVKGWFVVCELIPTAGPMI